MLLKDKIALVTGVANDHSIAYFIAKAFREQGARVILSYQGERIKDRVDAIAKEIGVEAVYECDATSEEDTKKMFDQIDAKFGGLDAMVHSIAFAKKEELTGGISNATSEGFKLAMDVSAYTLVSLSKYAAPLMEKRGIGSIMALTYLGSVRAVPNYNTMGVAKAALEACVRYLALEMGEKNIRVNGISPGPINTLAARGIPGFKTMYKGSLNGACIKRNIEGDKVAGTAVYLASDLSDLVTGMIIYVDGGFHCTVNFGSGE